VCNTLSNSATISDEYKLHQLSPYVGKLKSFTASAIVSRFSDPGDLIVDPFSGSGTIPLEAKLLGRSTFSSDVSDYAKVITLGKLSAPDDIRTASDRLMRLIVLAGREPMPDLRRVPAWVRSFFHPLTLKESIQFADVCLRLREYFYLSCLLGILHHQRPGFLSYPSSHLTPYLRDKKFPQGDFPDMYEYRDYRPRILKKVERALSNGYLRKTVENQGLKHEFRRSSIDRLTWPEKFGAVITSPPYMNALDYGRDNRLRLWFITRQESHRVDDRNISSRVKFESAMEVMARESARGLRVGGFLIIVIGELVDRGRQANTAQIARDVFNRNEGISFVSEELNPIPDIRRARRNCIAVKDEVLLIYKKK